MGGAPASGRQRLEVSWRQARHEAFKDQLKCSSCNTVELVKLVSTRFTEFLQRIFYVQIGSYECGEASYKRAHHCRKSTDPSTVHTIT